MKILICGDVNAGKSTLISKLVRDIGEQPQGYISVRLGQESDGRSYVYLYDAAQPPEDIKTAAVIKVLAKNAVEDRPEVLETLGVSLLESVPEGALVVMDEIGTLESKAPRFMEAVLDILGGNYRVLAAVKAQNTDFLRRVRSHPDCELYIITPENRDALYRQLKTEYGI